MKLLQIEAHGIPLFPDPLEISFYAQQRVNETDKQSLFHLFAGFYSHCANAFIGINASGKTSVLKVIRLALGILGNEPINHIEGRDILGNAQKVTLNLVFYSKPGKVCCLETEITAKRNKSGELRYAITGEKLWEKSADTKILKKNIANFAGLSPVSVRKADEAFLPDDVSIIIAHNKKEQETVDVTSMLSMTNINVLPVTEEIPSEIITFLDPTVETLSFEQQNTKTLIHLKFFGKEEILLNSPVELEHYLSSGTIKGITVFSMAKNTLMNGGYLIIDEIENHFNREIVATLLRFFMEANINKNGGVLIFTTHYPELLDEYERNDGIHIIRNRNGITVNNLSNILKRNDIKKSEAYESGFLEGTTPAYDAYIKLKKSLMSSLS